MNSTTAEYVDYKMMMQIKLVKYGIFLHSCHGSLTLVNKLSKATASWANGLQYICLRGAFFKSHMSSPSLSRGRLSRIVARKEYRLQTKSTSINSISKTVKHLNSRASGESKLTRATAQDFVQV